MKRLILLTMLSTIVLAAHAASSIADYRSRIGMAAASVDRLIAGERRDRRIVEEIKAVVPAAEIVEEEGDRIETSNAWLAADLDRYLNEKDPTKRLTILLGIRERLTGIQNSISELESARASTTKDSDKQKLSEILSRPEFQSTPPPEESLFQKWMRELQEWFDKNFPRPAVSNESSPAMGSIRLWLQVLVFALVIGLVGFLIYKFVPSFFGGGNKENVHRGDRVILGERIASDDSSANLFTEAERLAREGELRAAIRKGYIALLVELADRKLIGLARHKTNRDYLRDVRKRREVFDPMSGLTTSFERNWYGLRPATEGEWEEFRERYKETLRRI